MRFDGNKLKALREARSLDQTSLALAARRRRSGVTQSQISRYESGTQQPNGRNVVALAQALGVPVGELYEGEDNALRERREASGSEDTEGRPLTYDEYALYGQLTARIVAAKVKGREGSVA